MKKLSITLSLLLSLSLMGMETFQPEISTKPALKAILAKKYIQKRPLTKAEQTYLSKTSKRAIAAGLAALGVAAAAIAGTIGYRYKYARPDAEQVFAKFGMHLKDQELRNALIFANTNNLHTLFTAQPYRKDVYESFVQAYPQFKQALVEIRGGKISDLP